MSGAFALGIGGDGWGRLSAAPPAEAGAGAGRAVGRKRLFSQSTFCLGSIRSSGRRLPATPCSCKGGTQQMIGSVCSSHGCPGRTFAQIVVRSSCTSCFVFYPVATGQFQQLNGYIMTGMGIHIFYIFSSRLIGRPLPNLAQCRQ